ncbi:MAG: hypothetical protein GY816_00505, partial [Cytophagales bacterium]|nr:hypothetical protein [Cytophagales bacterium]
ERIKNRSEDHKDIADKNIYSCKLASGHQDEIEQIALDAEAPAGVLAALADHHIESENWSRALSMYERIDTTSNIYTVSTQSNVIRCLLQLGQFEKVETRAKGEQASIEVLITAANFFKEAKNWESALVWWQQIKERFPEYHNTVEGNILVCLLSLGRIEEAEKKIENPKSPAEVIIAGANFYHNSQQWGKALQWWQLVSERWFHYKDRAEGKAVECLLYLGREEDVEQRATKSGDKTEICIAAANFYDESR